MARAVNVTIKISESAKKALLAVAGVVQTKTKESMTIDAAIRELFKDSPNYARYLEEVEREEKKGNKK